MWHRSYYNSTCTTPLSRNFSVIVILQFQSYYIPMNMVVVFSPLSSSNSVSSVSSSFASTVTTAINLLVGNALPDESSKKRCY